MYHPRFKGKHYEMGQKMGKIFLKNNAKFPINLDHFQIQHGRKSGILLKKYFPEVTEEIRGITDIIGYDNEQFTSWMICMGSCLDIREDESVEVRGCTAFSFVRNGNIYYARNNDLPPFLKNISKSVYYQPENGNKFIINTSSFINGEEGINEHGLVAAMTFVKPKIKEIKPGLNSVFLVRYILEKCKSVKEGIEVLQKLPISSSCNILLSDKSGTMAVVECNPLKINIRHPEKSLNNENFIIAVNNFTSQEMLQYDASRGNEYFSEIRYKTAFDSLINNNNDDSLTYSKEILSGKTGFMCEYDKSLNFETIWSSIFDITNNKIYRAEGDPRKTKWIEDKRMSF